LRLRSQWQIENPQQIGRDMPTPSSDARSPTSGSQSQPQTEAGAVHQDSTIPHTTASGGPAITPALPQLPVPALELPGLELYENLGQGGMGVVYRARDVRLDRPRAVKVIRRGPFGDDEARDRFGREARAVARLDHVGVVRIYALGEHEDTLYICMELLEGGSLQGRLRQGPLEVRAAADLVRQLALAVQHAHDNRVLHRDLKPGNVLLTADGAPKVSDFGLAKLLDADDGLTHTGAVLGTPAYMAPEQAEGRSRDIAERTDVWALGAILYECLTGRPPFRAETRSETLELVRRQAPEAPRRLRADVPAELEAICLKCLEKRPEQRYATAAELAADLRDWLDGKPTRLRPARGPRRLVQAARRRPVLSLLAAFVLLAAVAAGLLAYFGHPDRPLWQMQAQLARGEPVELLGATGPPHWSRWWLREKDANSLVESDGTFIVHGWPHTLLELLPDTRGHSRYRIRTEIRHLKGDDTGTVGLYFAGTPRRQVTAPVLLVTFDDVHDEAARFNKAFDSLPPDARKGTPRSTGNMVRLECASCADRAGAPDLGNFSAPLAKECFKPSGYTGHAGDWRSVAVEVSPDVIRIFFDDKPVGEISPAWIEERNRVKLRQVREREPGNAALAGLVPELDLQGALGLYLFESYASFRNVRFEPLDGPGGPD
jgi:serine/threonine-protein kinase